MILFLFLGNTFFTIAQNDKDTKEALSKLDTTAFKGKAFLNKAQFIKSLVQPLRTKEKGKDGLPALTLTPRHFELLTTIVANADLNDKPKPKAVEKLQNLSRDQISSSNIIPIGIINADALVLTENQINENIKAKSQNKKADGKNYENVELITAGLLQGEIFQGNVSFRISPDLIQSNINNKIDHLEIDFQDGKGYRSFELKEQLIPYQFKTIGEVAITIKLVTKRGSFVTYNVLKINQLERPVPFEGKKIITAKKVVQDVVRSGKVTDSVVGGEYQIYTGCDGVFDRPTIIAEGFDIGQDINIDDMVAKYYPYLYAFRNHGYDLVFVNYSSGQDYIQNNAEVLKRVINEVNNRKVGSNKLVVVGESMSGLVARYALRSMERDNQTHNVSHFIAFDTPNQGANVPPGLVALGRRFYQHTGPFTALVLLLVPEVRAIYSPAARQLLIHQTSTFGRDPLFDSFRQELNNLGNGGYPNQGGIRNIALLNGALAGSPNLNYNFGTLNPGDKILDVDIVGILCNSFIDVWTNLLDANFKVYDADAIGICGISLGYENVNLNRNLDRTPGGLIRNGLGYGFPVYSTTNPSFSFVPTFSSIDYRGPLINDGDYTFSINANIIDEATSQTTNTALTPFVAIYGQNFFNTQHSQSRDLINAWNRLAVRENFGITNAEAVLANCSLPIPPVVMKTGTFFKVGRVNSTLPNSICKYARNYKVNLPNTMDLIIPNGNQTSNYEQFIRISGGSLTIPLRLDVNGWNIATFNYSGLGNGTYTISAVRKFYGSNTQEVTSSTTLQISGNCRIEANDCPEDNEEGEEIGVLADVNQSCYASKYNGVWVASLENGEFVSRSRLIANGMNVNSANCFAETDPSGGGYPACNCGFTLTSVTQTSGQATGNFIFNSCNATKIKWKIMDGATEIYSEEVEPSSAIVPFIVPSTVNSGNYQFVVQGVWCTGTTNSLPFNYVKPSGGGTGGGGGTTTDRTDGGNASDEGANNPVNEDEPNAFDNQNGTKWLIFNPTGNITYDFNGNDSYAINSYTITSANDAPDRDPKSWVLEGSNDNSTWAELNTRSGQTFGDRYETKPYTPNITTTAYKQYRLRVTENAGSDLLQIAEIQMFGPVGSGGGGNPSCSYTNGQFMTEWLGNEVIRAYTCGTKFYAKNDAGYFKSKSWLVGTGRFTTAETDCFEEVNPGCGGLRIAANSNESDEKITVYPNPTTGKIKIVFSLQKSENVWLNLYDVQGKSLDLRDFEGKIGRNEIEYDLQNYLSGAYFVNFQSSEKREILKITKLN
jgi:pimeloyl-ACP methyl ester carboxylesterase